ncbi:HEAT repeat domain-containing protein [Thermoproteota archaeon]
MNEVSLKQVIENLRNEDTRWDAILELKIHGSSTWVEPLIKLLDDPDWVVRWCVAEKLGDLADSRAVKPLGEALSDKDVHVRKSAEKALERFGSRCISELIKRYNYPDPRVRKSITKIICSMGHAIIPNLEQELPENDWILANSIVTLMWCVGGPKAEDALIRSLKNRAAQKSILPLLASLHSKRCVPHLLKVFDKPSMRRMVLNTLKRIGEETSYPIIINLVSSGSSLLSHRAEEVVAKIGENALPYMIRALSKNGSNKFRLVALIRQIGPEKVINSIHRLAEKDPEIKTLTKDIRFKFRYNPDQDKKDRGLLGLFR